MRKLILAAAVTTSCSVVYAAGAERPNLDPLLVSSYANEAMVTEETAKQRLLLMEEVRKLQARISGESWFAGLYVEHTPRFQVHVLRSSAHAASKPLASAGSLARHVVVRDVLYSMDELEGEAKAVLAELRVSGVQADLEIDVQQNAIKLRVPDVAEAAELSAVVQAKNQRLASNLVIEQGALVAPLAPIYGGVSLGNCTSGFGLVNPNGTRAVLTAGHCYPAAQFYQQLQLPWGDYRKQGSWDAGWLTPRSFTPTNQIWNGSSYWSITSIRAWGSQVIGDYVCKGGRVTGVQCGYIRAKNIAPTYVTNPNADFISIGSTSMQGQPGDSGGPVWNGPVAIGIISGGRQVDAEYQVVYMAADRVYPATGHYILVSP